METLEAFCEPQGAGTCLQMPGWPGGELGSGKCQWARPALRGPLPGPSLNSSLPQEGLCPSACGEVAPGTGPLAAFEGRPSCAGAVVGAGDGPGQGRPLVCTVLPFPRAPGWGTPTAAEHRGAEEWRGWQSGRPDFEHAAAGLCGSCAPAPVLKSAVPNPAWERCQERCLRLGLVSAGGGGRTRHLLRREMWECCLWGRSLLCMQAPPRLASTGPLP